MFAKTKWLALAFAALFTIALLAVLTHAIDCCYTRYAVIDSSEHWVRACALAYGTNADNSYGYATGEVDTGYVKVVGCTEKSGCLIRYGIPRASIYFQPGTVGTWLRSMAQWNSRDWFTAEAESVLSGQTWFCRV
ncbi:MAG: hypothetical protein QW189_05245 [Thermofilaceae archaeon]